MRKFISFKLVFFLLILFIPQSFANEKNWNLLKEGGKIVLIRHSLANILKNGTPISGGDADGFTLDSCEKQRVLGKEGIEQSIRMGQEFRKRKIPVAEVLSSIWCRCQETAGYAFGQYKVSSFLNSTFQSAYYKNQPKQLKALREYVSKFNDKKSNLILVTHYSIITAITDASPGQGTLVIVDKNFNVQGTIHID